MNISVTRHEDHVEVEIDGMSVVLGRSHLDGALKIDVNTEEVGLSDEHPATGVPRLCLAINEAVHQLDQDGEWVERSPYPPVTVLDHLAVAALDAFAAKYPALAKANVRWRSPRDLG